VARISLFHQASLLKSLVIGDLLVAVVRDSIIALPTLRQQPCCRGKTASKICVSHDSNQPQQGRARQEQPPRIEV